MKEILLTEKRWYSLCYYICMVENKKVRTAFSPGTRPRILTPKFETILFPYWVVHIFLCAQ